MKTKNILIALLIIVVVVARFVFVLWFVKKQRMRLEERQKAEHPYYGDVQYNKVKPAYNYKESAFYKKIKYAPDGSEFSVWFAGTPVINKTMARIRDSIFINHDARYEDTNNNVVESVLFIDAGENKPPELMKFDDDAAIRLVATRGGKIVSDNTRQGSNDIGDYTEFYSIFLTRDRQKKKSIQVRKYIGKKTILVQTVIEDTENYPSSELSTFLGSVERK